ncbi:hypothetical protein [Shewanella sp.]|uniref:hypothetical protein n=1 Tax=Shewanella sp. TaxID=50422 RepID=UPI004053ECB0
MRQHSAELNLFNRTHNRPSAAIKRQRSAIDKARGDRLRQIEDIKPAKSLGISMTELGAL